MSSNTEKGSQLTNLFSWIGAKLKGLWASAKPEVTSVFKQFIEAFEDVAIEAVKAEALKVLSGDQKFSNAVATVKQAVVSAGWSAGTTALETLVQDAYVAVKAQNGVPLVTPPPALTE